MSFRDTARYVLLRVKQNGAKIEFVDSYETVNDAQTGMGADYLYDSAHDEKYHIFDSIDLRVVGSFKVENIKRFVRTS